MKSLLRVAYDNIVSVFDEMYADFPSKIESRHKKEDLTSVKQNIEMTSKSGNSISVEFSGAATPNKDNSMYIEFRKTSVGGGVSGTDLWTMRDDVNELEPIIAKIAGNLQADFGIPATEFLTRLKAKIDQRVEHERHLAAAREIVSQLKVLGHGS
jgi:hypothetical protein